MSDDAQGSENHAASAENADSNRTAATAPVDVMTREWTYLAARGALALVFGIVASVWPIGSALTLIVLWGIWAAVDGIASLAMVVSPGAGGWRRLAGAVMGVLALLAALAAFTRPGLTAVTLTWVLGIWLIARGATSFVQILTPAPRGPRALVGLSAVVDLVLGIVVAAHPGRAAVGVALTMGILAIAWGLVLIAAALAARAAVSRSASQPATARSSGPAPSAVVPPQAERTKDAAQQTSAGPS